MPEQSIGQIDNPFTHYLNLTRWQKLQVFIMSITIAPLRFVLALILFGICWTLASIFTLGADVSKPASRARNALYQILQMIGRSIMFVCGFHYFKITGKRALYEEAPVLVVVPHSSYWDVGVFFVTSPLPCALSKFENFQIPIFGTLMKAVQPILVRRDDRDSKQDTVNAIRSRLASKQRWPQLIVFPEGTCTNKKYMIKFKLGAFLAGTAIQPVIMRYKSAIDISTWTEISPSALYLIWLSLCQIQIKLEVDYLPVYKPSAEEIDDPIVYAQNVQKYLSTILKVECSEHTYEDRLLMKYAGKLKFPKTETVILFHSFKKKFDITLADAMERLKEFAAIPSPKSDGRIDLEGFSKLLNMPLIPALEKIFSTLSSNSDGLSFHHYIWGYYFRVKKLKEEQFLTNSYKSYCTIKENQTAIIKNQIISLIALLEKLREAEVDSKEKYLQFMLSHPFHCDMLSLENENYSSDSYPNSSQHSFETIDPSAE